MTERAEPIRRFLERAGWGEASCTPIAGDASPRRYARLAKGPERAILMDARRAREEVRPFLAIARHLAKLGYSAPRILAADPARGLVLLEDLGRGLYTRLLTRPDGPDARRLYGAAVELLVGLHRAPPPAGTPPYDDARLLEEALLLVDWYIPRQRGRAPDAALRRSYQAIWRALLPQARIGPEVLVLRDYHADNLLWLPERAGPARVGLLDFQDAVIGPRAYDLVSLLEDARRDVAPVLVEDSIAAYLAAQPELDEAAFRAACAVLGAQRNCKIIGIFTRLCLRDAKPGYLDLLPRVWRLLERDLAHPALAPMRDWIDREIPPGRRERAP